MPHALRPVGLCPDLPLATTQAMMRDKHLVDERTRSGIQRRYQFAVEHEGMVARSPWCPIVGDGSHLTEWRNRPTICSLVAAQGALLRRLHWEPKADESGAGAKIRHGKIAISL